MLSIRRRNSVMEVKARRLSVDGTNTMVRRKLHVDTVSEDRHYISIVSTQRTPAGGLGARLCRPTWG